MSDSEIRSLRSAIDGLRKEVLFNRDEFLRFVVVGFGEEGSGLMARVKRIEEQLEALTTPRVVQIAFKSFHDPRGVCVTEPVCELCAPPQTEKK